MSRLSREISGPGVVLASSYVQSKSKLGVLLADSSHMPVQVSAGQHPYMSQKSDIEVMKAMLSGIPPAHLLSLDIPASVKALLSQCWERTPGDRPTARSIEEAIRKYIDTAVQMSSATRGRHAKNNGPVIDYQKLEISLVCRPQNLAGSITYLHCSAKSACIPRLPSCESVEDPDGLGLLGRLCGFRGRS